MTIATRTRATRATRTAKSWVHANVSNGLQKDKLLIGATGAAVAKHLKRSAAKFLGSLCHHLATDTQLLFVASGGMTHNLALDFEAPLAQFAVDFDTWAAESLRAANIDAVIDFRNKAPAPNLAHPDGGAHFRVLLVALGVALGKAAA